VPNDSQVPAAAAAGQSVGLVLDRNIFVDRGDLISTPAQPAKASRRLRARIFWLHDKPLTVGANLIMRVGMAESQGTVAAIDNAIDPGQLAAQAAGSIAQNNVGEIEIALAKPIAADLHADNPRTGRLVLDLGGRIAGGGLVLSTADTVPSSTTVVRPAGIDLTPRAAELNRALAPLTPLDRLKTFRAEVEGRIVFTTSFGIEDQVISHLILESGIDIALTTLDTGRLFPETYDVWAETERRYGRRIHVVYPDHSQLEALVEKQGINGFYEAREARTACCHVRKVEPLNRALAGASGWIAGLRADQSAHRQQLDFVTADTARGVLKLNPLFDWTRDQAVAFAAEHSVPVNSLHDRGFLSIGCAPCTRAIRAGEPERAGRWWWEQEEKKECGLHWQR
jgi:phosphoadenosine phosphosulfate reductase